jgi:hypothetical protein
MTPGYRLTVVVAIEHSAENVAESFANLNPSDHPDVEFIFCHAASESSRTSAHPLAEIGPLPANVKSLEAKGGSRIPHMWRDGLMAAQSELVALLSAHCIPASDWLSAALALTFGPTEAAIGGYLTNSGNAKAPDWAIYLLRYVNYSRPRPVDRCLNIAADNAVYRRSEILRYPQLLARGFWEPEFHREFLSRGLTLRLSPALQAIHRNRYSPRAFAKQRRDHGYEFGRDRGRTLSTVRLVGYVLAAPLIPLIFFSKVRTGAARQGWRQEMPFGTTLWLAFFILHWAAGEAAGVVRELVDRTGMT